MRKIEKQADQYPQSRPMSSQEYAEWCQQQGRPLTPQQQEALQQARHINRFFSEGDFPGTAQERHIDEGGEEDVTPPRRPYQTPPPTRGERRERREQEQEQRLQDAVQAYEQARENPKPVRSIRKHRGPFAPHYPQEV